MGSKLLACLSEDPRIGIRGVCRNEVSAGPLRLHGYDVRCGSPADPTALREMIGDCEVIVNLVADSGAPVRVRLGQEQLLNSICGLPGRRRLVHFSSVAVYGSYIDPRRSTFERPRPSAPYGREKRHLERYLERASRASLHEAIILRLGHVYGAGQRLSASLLESAREPRWRLPFDGRLPSNAIHVRNVAAAIRTLILDWPQPGTYNLVDAPPSTWREVLDWHADAIGTPPVPAMTQSESEQIASHHRLVESTPLTLRAAQETRVWARRLPGSLLASCPTLKNLGTGLLTSVRSEMLEGMLQAKSQDAAIGHGDDHPLPAVAPRLVSQGTPGPALAYPNEVGREEAMALATWHERYSTPDAILDWAAPAVGTGP